MKLSKRQAVITSAVIGIFILLILHYFGFTREGMDGGTGGTGGTSVGDSGGSGDGGEAGGAPPSASESNASLSSAGRTSTRSLASHHKPKPGRHKRYWGSRGTGDGHGYYWNYPLYWSDWPYYDEPLLPEPEPEPMETKTVIIQQATPPQKPIISPLGPILALTGVGVVGWALLRNRK
jgi:hypothetical protein